MKDNEILIVNNCPFCNQPSSITVKVDEFHQYVEGAFVQDAFPTLSAEQREIIQTGIHPSCWKATMTECERDLE